MVKLVILKLIGNLQEGYKVLLEISEEGQRPYIESEGHLPLNNDLAKKIVHHWQNKYRNLVAPYRRKTWSVVEQSSVEQINFAPRIEPIKITYDGSVNARINECKKSADELETTFLQWLESEGFRDIDKCLRIHLNPDEIIRFLIRAEDTQLQKLPWHTWDLFENLETEPSFAPPKLKSISKEKNISKNKQSVRILAILGHDDGINIKKDEQLLKKLAPDAQFLVEPTRSMITDQLWEQDWDIIFFAGHSETEGDIGKIYINPTEYLTIDELWFGLRKAVKNGLQVAIFNSCDGLGLAHKLTNDFQIPNLIVMRELVPDEVAQKFLKYFLSAFEGGRPFHLAVKEARERLQGLEEQFPCASWLPAVYQNPLEAALYWKDLTVTVEEKDVVGAKINSKGIPSNPTPVPQLTWKNIRQTTAMGLLLASCVIGLRWFGVLEPVELSAFDYLMRSRPAESLDPNILLVEATSEEAENVEEYGYPISDGKLAALLEKLQANDPLAIGLMSQRRQQRGTDEERTALIKQFNVNPSLFTMCSVNEGTDELHGAPDEFSAQQQQQQVGFGDFYVNSGLLGESVYRQLLSYKPQALGHASPCITHSSFGLHLAYQFLSEAGIEGVFSEQKELQFDDVTLHKLPRRFGGYQSLNGYSNQIILNYRSGQHKPAMTVTVDDVFSGKVKPSFIKDRIVIVGTNNPHVVNYFNTPYGPMPPLYIQGHMVSNLIQAVLNRRPLIWALPQWLDYLFVGLAALLGCGTFLILKFPLKIGLVSGLFVWGWYQVCLVILSQGGWMPFIPVLLAGLLSVWGAYVINAYPRLTNHNHK